MNSAEELEQTRVATLRDLGILDTRADTVLDELTRLTSRVLDVPIALISLIDRDRQWFKSNVGIERVKETPREWAFCDHAIRTPDLFHVADAGTDERFSNNPLVINEPHIRFYAGVPLHALNGQALGTLCAIDRRPRNLSESEKEVLRQLAYVAEQWIARNFIYSPVVSLRPDEWELPQHDGRSKIVHATFLLILQRDTLSLREVAKHATVSLSTVQHHFNNKDALLVATVDDIAAIWTTRMNGCNTPELLVAHLVTAIASGFLPAFAGMRRFRQIESHWLATQHLLVNALHAATKRSLHADPSFEVSARLLDYLLGRSLRDGVDAIADSKAVFRLLVS